MEVEPDDRHDDRHNDRHQEAVVVCIFLVCIFILLLPPPFPPEAVRPRPAAGWGWVRGPVGFRRHVAFVFIFYQAVFGRGALGFCRFRKIVTRGRAPPKIPMPRYSYLPPTSCIPPPTSSHLLPPPVRGASGDMAPRTGGPPWEQPDVSRLPGAAGASSIEYPIEMSSGATPRQNRGFQSMKHSQ